MNDLIDAIRNGVKHRIKEITEEEVENARRKVTERINSSVDQIALNVLSYYEFHDRGTHLVIEVKKERL